MIGKGSVIRKYQRILPTELSKRYGGSAPYTQSQVEKTIRDLGLSRRHIKYAYIMYCEKEKLDRETFTDELVERMSGVITAAVGGGIVAAPLDTLFGGADGDGGGFGDGGGGGE